MAFGEREPHGHVAERCATRTVLAPLPLHGWSAGAPGVTMGLSLSRAPLRGHDEFSPVLPGATALPNRAVRVRRARSVSVGLPWAYPVGRLGAGPHPPCGRNGIAGGTAARRVGSVPAHCIAPGDGTGLPERWLCRAAPLPAPSP